MAAIRTDFELFGGEFGTTGSLDVQSGSNNYQIVITIDGDVSSAPAAPTVTLGGNAMTQKFSSTYHSSGKYWRICAFEYNESSAGSYDVVVSASVGYSVFYAYSFSNAQTPVYGNLSTTSDHKYWAQTADYNNSSTVVTIIAEFEGTPTEYSDTELLDYQADSGETVFTGHELNSTTSTSSGFDWTGYGSVSFKFLGVFLDSIAPVSHFCDPLLLSGNDDGTSWEDAFRSFPDAVSSIEAASEDILYVKAGTITDINEVIEPPSYVSIYGGFRRSLTGTDADVDERQPFVDKTIIRMTDANYSTTEFGCINGTEDNVRIDGFHFENCANQQAEEVGYGGAIRIYSATGWVIANCQFTSCVVAVLLAGGAIAVLEGSSVVINGCVFKFCGASVLSQTSGGAIYCDDSQISVYYSLIYQCTAQLGGGIYIGGTSGTCTIQDCSINECDSDYGDSLYIKNTDNNVNITRCRINDGKGSNENIYLEYDASNLLTISNCLICGSAGNGIENSTGGTVGATYVANCTICDNGGYGVVFSASGTRIMRLGNCIVRDNTAGDINGTLTGCTYSDIEGGYSGTGNVDVDPLFRGAGDPEPYALNADSDCVDGGNGSVNGYSAIDLLGYTRTGTPDMGAIEFIGTVWPIGAIDTSKYRLVMSGVTTTGLSPFNMAFPYLLHEIPDGKVKTGISSLVTECHPLQFGAEEKIDNATATVIDFFKTDNSRINIPRINNTEATDPTWTAEFNADYQTDVDWIGGNGVSSKGLKFVTVFRDEPNQPVFDVVRYSAMFTTDSLTDELVVYNVWIEGMPFTTADTEPCAKWILTDDSVSEPDYPVSSGLMIELLRILNKIEWEMRGPMSVPVFGQYIVWTPPVVV
jgi:hypothetical protein